MILDKEDCIASIADGLEQNVSLAKVLVIKFADDPRNILAAATLDRLAIYISRLTDEQWLELKPYFGGWASESWRKGLSQAARQVGFHHKARDLTAFVKSLIGVLSLPSVAA